MMLPIKVIHLLSGGLDSTVLLYDLHKQGLAIHCLLFHYGQRHLRELDFARKHCHRLSVDFTVVELFQIKGLFSKCALTDGEGGDIVPHRNAVFLSIATSMAISARASLVTIASNKDDAVIFPDCTHDFLKAVNAANQAAGTDVEACGPYLGMSKWQIVQHAKELGAPWEESYSCYVGGIKPCGKCNACKLREESAK